MKRDLRAEIRALLLAHPEGMTTRDLVIATKASDKSVRHSLSCMPDAYIDRWEFPRQGPLAQVYCAVVVPEDCPRPIRTKRTPEERAAYHRGYTMAWHKRKAEEAKQAKAEKAEQAKAAPPAQGLTTIRGPWPMP